ncbi:MAG: tetratricopeptide repeat protein [Bdellovibrionaceae bacterium]|nr:tetratricopeptide repeat protein [Pseudobdellovibrionaceae bacterium]
MRTPSSRVFAPLAEAYRKMGLLQQALDICEKGIKFNPNYPSGLVAYGKILFELNRHEEAAHIFGKAGSQQPDNILAYKLQALSLSKLGQHKEALKAYKRVLFLNPTDMQAKKFIENWEYLEASDYTENAFKVDTEEKELISDSDPIHVAHFVDALIVRNEIQRARSIVETALCLWPNHPLLQKQLIVLKDFISEEKKDQFRRNLHVTEVKKQALEKWLQRIETLKARASDHF